MQDYVAEQCSEALAAVADHILTNQQLLPAMRREARREFEMQYTAEAHYRRSREIFDEAISRCPYGHASQA
jgi:glycosyltransferase involved in cell wall biosynthesis